MARAGIVTPGDFEAPRFNCNVITTHVLKDRGKCGSEKVDHYFSTIYMYLAINLRLEKHQTK